MSGAHFFSFMEPLQCKSGGFLWWEDSMFRRVAINRLRENAWKKHELIWLELPSGNLP
jgi:hypothetical protein